MKYIYPFSVLLFLVLFSSQLQAQQERVLRPQRGKVKKDSLQLGCILTNYVYAPDDEELDILGQKEIKAVLSSASDTTVKAPWDLTVSGVKRLEDGSFELVAFHQDYWFWFSGLDKVRLYKNQQLKKGDAIGYLEPGKKLELLVFDFETPVDPKKYITCK
ncbi:MAG: hypothetical protein ABWZ25_09630 [Chitinophagaceae bacterium]